MTASLWRKRVKWLVRLKGPVSHFPAGTYSIEVERLHRHCCSVVHLCRGRAEDEEPHAAGARCPFAPHRHRLRAPRRPRAPLPCFPFFLT